MAASPLLGYNTNVRHLGKLYHIQTEDSGSSHGHIFTHLFADGGRIIASKKTTYSQYVGTTRYPDVVKQLMRESHKAMFIALRDGIFDEDEAAGARKVMEMTITLPDEAPPAPPARPVAPAATTAAVGGPEPDVDALERAAAARLAESPASSRYQSPQPAAPVTAASVPPAPAPPAAVLPAAVAANPRPPSAAPHARKAAPRPDPHSESIFGGDLLSEKSLDEVILSYLAEDVEDE